MPGRLLGLGGDQSGPLDREHIVNPASVNNIFEK